MAKRRVVFFVGAAIAALCTFKLSVIGYYENELVWILPLLAVGALVMWGSTKMSNET